MTMLICIMAAVFPVAIVLLDNRRKEKKLERTVKKEKERREKERVANSWEKEVIKDLLTKPEDATINQQQIPCAEPTTEEVQPKQVRTYGELLKDPRWRDKRLEILKRDGRTCQYCGKQEPSMHVHHKYYMKYPDGKKLPPWNYPDDALITLCENCHKWWHSTHKYKVYWHKYDNEYEY